MAETKTKPSFPLATVKRLMKQVNAEIRVTPEAVEYMDKLLAADLLEATKKAFTIAQIAKRKTIGVEDLKASIS